MRKEIKIQHNMERDIKTYLDILGHRDYMAMSDIDALFNLAIKDGVTKLI